MKRILMMAPTYLPVIGGSEIHISQLLNELKKREIGVTLVTSSYGAVSRIEHEGPHTIIRNRIPGQKRVLQWISRSPLAYLLFFIPGLFFSGLMTLLFQRRHFALIHCHSYTTASVGVLLARLFRLPLVVSTHGNYFSTRDPDRHFHRYRNNIGRLLSRVDFILTSGHRSRREILGLGLDAHKVRVYTYWIDTELFRPQETSPPPKKGSEAPFRVLFVGRLHESKGIPVLIELLKQRPDLEFQLVGTGPMEAELHGLQAHYPHLTHVGPLPHDELPEFYRKADVTVMPTTNDGESYNIVLMESICCGTLVIASQAGGMYETLHMDGAPISTVGISLPEITAETIGAAIDAIKDNPEKQAAFRNACPSYGRTFFSVSNSAAILESYGIFMENHAMTPRAKHV